MDLNIFGVWFSIVASSLEIIVAITTMILMWQRKSD